MTVQDAAGATVVTDTSAVQLAITTPAGATLTCDTNPMAAAAGVATFSGCNIDRPGTYTLTATDGALTAATSASTTITIGPAARLGFVQQPSSAISLVAFATQPHVAIQDLGRNTIVGNTSSVTLTITTPAGATLTCTNASPLPAVAGVASFTGCHIDRAGSYTLHAADGALAPGTSASFAITAAGATHLAFTVQPSGTATNGTFFGTSPTVTVEDASGNAVGTANSIVLSVTGAPGGVTLSCTGSTTEATVAGVAAFAGCSMTGAAATYTLHATNGTFTADSTSIVLGVGAATDLVFTTQPSGTAPSGAAFGTDPSVTVEDAGGNTVTAASSIVLSVTGAPAGVTLACSGTTTTKATVAGVAAFTGCSITGVTATYSLHATNGTVTGDSSDVVLTFGAATQLVFTDQPSGTATNAAAFAADPSVSVEDASGNVVTSANSIVLSITGAPGGVTLTCTDSTTTVATVAGVAVFAGCAITGTAATYTLHATNGAVTGDSSNVVLSFGVATHLVFTGQPSGTVANTVALAAQPSVTVEDSGGNTVTTANSIVLSVTGAPGGVAVACSGTTTTKATVAGIAAFTGCSLTGTAATYTLHATNGTVTGDSSDVVLTFGAATQLVFTVQPSGTAPSGTPFATDPSVTVEDVSGNIVTSANSIVLSVTGAPGGVVVACTGSTTTVPTVAGVAAFVGCSITGTAATYTLHATNSTVTGDSSSVIIT